MTNLEQFVDGLRKRAQMPVGAPAVQANPNQSLVTQQAHPAQTVPAAQPAPTTRQAPAAPAVPAPVVPTGSPLPAKPKLTTAKPVPQAAPLPKAQLAKTADRIPGGKGDGKPDTAFNPRQLRAGIAVEKEHSPDKEIRKEISKDHLTEHSDYYSRLASIEPDAAEALKKAELISVFCKAGRHLKKRAALLKVARKALEYPPIAGSPGEAPAEEEESGGEDNVLPYVGKGLAIGAGAGAGLGGLAGGIGELQAMSRGTPPLASEKDKKLLERAKKDLSAGKSLGKSRYKQVTGAVLRHQKAEAKLPPAGSMKRLREVVKGIGGWGTAAKGVGKATGGGILRGTVAGAIPGVGVGILAKLLKDHMERKRLEREALEAYLTAAQRKGGGRGK